MTVETGFERILNTLTCLDYNIRYKVVPISVFLVSKIRNVSVINIIITMLYRISMPHVANVTDR